MADEEDRQQSDHLENEGAVGYQASSDVSSTREEGRESIEDVYAQLAQKDRDLVLAAELGKALLDSNQELQSRYDQLLEEFNSKVESLQQEKYDLHLDLEKLETEHLNRVKDLQDDVAALKAQLLENSQHKQASETETIRCLQEAQQKSEFLADQVQQACHKEEELLEKLEEEKENNKSNRLVIQDHLEHIAMLREQVECLSEKLKEVSQALLEAQRENELLLEQQMNLKKQLQSIESVEKQGQGAAHKKNHKYAHHHPIPSSAPYQTHQGNNGRTKTNSHNEQSVPELSGDLHGYHNISFSEFHQTSLFKPVEIPCRTGELAASERLSPAACSEQAMITHQKSPVPNNSVLSEFSTPYRHTRNRSDCSISSMTEGSRKRHYETIALSSDEEDESLERNFKSAHCKQSLLSKLIDSTNSQSVQAKTNRMREIMGDRDSSVTSSPPPVSSMLEESRESGFSQAMSISGDESSSTAHALSVEICDNSIPSSSDRTWPGSESYSHFPHHSPRNGREEVSLFDELSTQVSGYDRQDSGNSEKSLFDELSGHVGNEDFQENPDFPSSCLLGHPDFFSHSGWLDDRGDSYSSLKPGSQQVDSKQSDSDSNYTSEWPLLSSVSADMLEDDDFECDDDDFLVGNTAGSTLSIGDSGVGPMLKSFHSSLDAEPSDTSDPWLDSDGRRWTGKVKGDENNQALETACQQLRQLVERLGGQKDASGKSEVISSTEEFHESDFDQLLSLIHELRMCVDQLDQGEMPIWRMRTGQLPWQRGEKDHSPCLSRELKRKSQHFLATPELKKSISSSSLFVRRSL